MTFLLDVNVLIALVDPGHAFHALATDWFTDVGQIDWATCPIVQNGAVRVFGHPRLAGGPGSPTAAATLFRPWFAHANHSFWPDDIGLLDADLIDPKFSVPPHRSPTPICWHSPSTTAECSRPLTAGFPPSRSAEVPLPST